MNDELDEPQIPAITAMIRPLPYTYDPEDSRVTAILDEAAAFCGMEFTEVPPNPDSEEEGGDVMPLDGDTPVEEEDNDKNHDGIPDIEEPASPAEPYPEQTDELDKMREAYKNALAKNTAEKEEYWAILWQVIRLISTMGCWTESHDDTFIIQYRTQQYAAEQASSCTCHCCKCDEDVIVIPIDYAPLEINPDESLNPIEKKMTAKPFIKGVISVVVNGKREEVTIDQEYLNERYDPYTQKLYINREDFPELLYNQGRCCCLCLRKLTITLWYNAGYYGIPKTLLPLVCQLVGKIKDSKKPLSDCEAAVTQVCGLLKSMKTGNIQYAWSDNDSKLANTQALFTEIYNIASMTELFGLSRCDIINQEEAGDVI